MWYTVKGWFPDSEEPTIVAVSDSKTEAQEAASLFMHATPVTKCTVIDFDPTTVPADPEDASEWREQMCHWHVYMDEDMAETLTAMNLKLSAAALSGPPSHIHGEDCSMDQLSCFAANLLRTFDEGAIEAAVLDNSASVE